MLVSKQHALAHLRIDAGGPEDALIDLYLAGAEQAACDYLNRAVYASPEALSQAQQAGTVGAHPMVCNFAVQAAILLILGHLYANREEVADSNLRQLPMGARSLLWPHRVMPGI